VDKDNRYIKIKLDDSIINALDEDGRERLKLSVKVGGKDVLMQFPSYGDWDFYVQDLGRLMIILSQTVGDIELNANLVPEEHFRDWSYIVGEALKYKQCRELIEKIFLQYLKPIVEDEEDSEKYLRKYMSIMHLYYIFQAIINIEDWIKKKASEIIKETFQVQTGSSLTPISQKNTTQQRKTWEPGQALELV
jgi:hypothetical protein